MTMTIGQVLEKLKEARNDTYFSKKIFDIEEGKEDIQLTSGRRDWLIISEIYGNPAEERYTQRFHLENYLNFKLYDGLPEDTIFRTKCYRYIRNVALLLYIREEIFGESKEELEPLYKKACTYYKNEENEINNASFAAKMRK